MTDGDRQEPPFRARFGTALPPRPVPPSPRRRLPERRLTAREWMTWADASGHEMRLLVDVGFYPDGAPGEIFATGPKTGSTLRFLIEDQCISISIHLQQGMTLDSIAPRFGSHGIAGPLVRFVQGLVERLGVAPEAAP